MKVFSPWAKITFRCKNNELKNGLLFKNGRFIGRIESISMFLVSDCIKTWEFGRYLKGVKNRICNNIFILLREAKAL